jgi:hypothetical protein
MCTHTCTDMNPQQQGMVTPSLHNFQTLRKVGPNDTPRVRFPQRRNKGSVLQLPAYLGYHLVTLSKVFPFEALLQLSTQVNFTRWKILVEWRMRQWRYFDILYKYIGV